MGKEGRSEYVCPGMAREEACGERAASLPLRQEARDLNVLARFLGQRDLPRLSRDGVAAASARAAVGTDGVAVAGAGAADDASRTDATGGPGVARVASTQVDVAVLFGGSILAGGEVLADAMRADVARAYVIVGGAGHTTETLRERARAVWPRIDVAPGAAEAEIFDAYLREYHGMSADLLETRSTNCGNNITYLLELLESKGITAESFLLMQEATMMRRMVAGLRFHRPDAAVLAYATYAARVVADSGSLSYEDEPLGMWGIERYRTLLMGEVPRLRDDASGYGPKGAGWIAHVDIPRDVEDAFTRLRAAHPEAVRVANPAYASR